MQQRLLNDNLIVLQRGWLSANNVILLSDDQNAIIDTGYCTHSKQTLSLVKSVLGTRNLDFILNTHLHSDHCGGNAALQSHYTWSKTLIPPGDAQAVRQWDTHTLTYEPTGQLCPRFRCDGVISPGTEFRIGDQLWQVHAARGHDPHSVIFFEPTFRILISADALWESGFGVVFPELDGIAAYDEVAQTLDLIESLSPTIIIPGHGAVFHDLQISLTTARKRLDQFQKNPKRHADHAAKVLIKYKLLEVQKIRISQLKLWAIQTPYFCRLYQTYFSDVQIEQWLDILLSRLDQIKVAAIHDEFILNHESA